MVKESRISILAAALDIILTRGPFSDGSALLEVSSHDYITRCGDFEVKEDILGVALPGQANIFQLPRFGSPFKILHADPQVPLGSDDIHSSSNCVDGLMALLSFRSYRGISSGQVFSFGVIRLINLVRLLKYADLCSKAFLHRPLQETLQAYSHKIPSILAFEDPYKLPDFDGLVNKAHNNFAQYGKNIVLQPSVCIYLPQEDIVKWLNHSNWNGAGRKTKVDAFLNHPVVGLNTRKPSRSATPFLESSAY